MRRGSSGSVRRGVRRTSVGLLRFDRAYRDRSGYTGDGIRFSPVSSTMLTRPNDPLVALEVRSLAEETVDECIEAGAAEVVSELAMPLQAYGLALLLNLSPGHADEWISWGTDPLYAGTDTSPEHLLPLVDYARRQLMRANARGGHDFFAALAQAGPPAARPTFREQRAYVVRLLSAERAAVVSALACLLEWLAGDGDRIAALRRDAAFRASTIEKFLAPLPGPDGLGRFYPGLGLPHARLVARALIDTVTTEIDRLTVIEREPAAGGSGSNCRALLLAFKPRD